MEKMVDVVTAQQDRRSRGTGGGGSTIRVDAKLEWPTLSDDDKGKDVEYFCMKFEEIVCLPNNGAGMPGHEKLLALRSCLRGSRRCVCDNIMKVHKAKEDGSIINPAEAYTAVQKRLMRFTETMMEKQLRVRRE